MSRSARLLLFRSLLWILLIMTIAFRLLAPELCTSQVDVGFVLGGGWTRSLSRSCSMRVFDDVFPGEVFEGSVSRGIFYPQKLLYADWRGKFWRSRWKQLVVRLGEKRARIIFGMITGFPLTVPLRYKLSTWSLVHLFVVSGTHLDMVALILYSLGLELLVPVGLLGFAYMVGWPPSMVRALIFWIVMTILRHLGVERVHVPTLAAFTSLLGIWALPHAVSSLSFWLSLAIASALVWAFQNRDYLLPVLSVWFISVLTFSGLSLTVLLYPLIALASAVFMAVFLFAILFPSLSWLAGYFADVILAIPPLGFPFYMRMCSLWAMLVLGFILIRLGWVRAGLFVAIVPVLISALLMVLYPAYVAVFDVGEGSSAIIRSSGFTVLVDTGRPNAKALFGITRGLSRLGVNRLDFVILSHPDEDHTGGYRFIPGLSEIPAITNDMFCEAIRSVGDVFLWFPPCISGWRDNERSIVVYKRGNFVIFGDLEDRGMDRFLQDMTSLVCPAQLVVMPHHGSWDDSLPSMLDSCMPKVAVLSVGPNPYGHPHSRTIALLGARMVPVVWRTDRMGTGIFSLIERVSWQEYVR